MSGNSQFVADSLSELLASIADGVRDAQQALIQLPGIDAYGRPLPSYHLPYLDFTLNVDVASETSDTGQRRIKMLPISSSSSSASNRIHSSVSGRFVAVPPGEGLPVPVINLNITRDTSNSSHFILEVLLANTSGEIIQGANLEVNIDPIATAALNVASNDVHQKASLTQALIRTNEFGRAYTKILLNSGFSSTETLVISVDFNLQSSQISLNPGAFL